MPTAEPDARQCRSSHFALLIQTACQVLRSFQKHNEIKAWHLGKPSSAMTAFAYLPIGRSMSRISVQIRMGKRRASDSDLTGRSRPTLSSCRAHCASRWARSAGPRMAVKARPQIGATMRTCYMRAVSSRRRSQLLPMCCSSSTDQSSEPSSRK